MSGPTREQAVEWWRLTQTDGRGGDMYRFAALAYAAGQADTTRTNERLIARLEKCAALLDCVDTCSKNNFSNLCSEEADEIRELILDAKSGES